MYDVFAYSIFSWFISHVNYLIYRSPVKTCKAYIPKRPRFEEPILSSSGSSNGDFDGGYFPSGKSTGLKFSRDLKR